MFEGAIAMICSRWRFRRAIPGLAALGVALVLAPMSRADVLYTGNGATAGAFAFGQESVQSGSTPAAVDATTSSPGLPAATADASASATPGAADLLQVHVAFSAPNVTSGNYPWMGSWDAGAQWGNVTAAVQAPSGSPMPSSIRLEFQVNYSAADVNLNEGSSPGRIVGVAVTGGSYFLPPAGTALQDGEQPAQIQPNGSLTAGFHVDVPLSASGVSTSSFSVVLSDWFPGLPSNLSTSINDALSVSLTGIYLPDGTSLTADGYSVTFHSAAGPIRLEPVPEPATWAAWGVIAAYGAWTLRRRRARA
jgi:hypothetical protein